MGQVQTWSQEGCNCRFGLGEYRPLLSGNIELEGRSITIGCFDVQSARKVHSSLPPKVSECRGLRIWVCWLTRSLAPLESRVSRTILCSACQYRSPSIHVSAPSPSHITEKRMSLRQLDFPRRCHDLRLSASNLHSPVLPLEEHSYRTRQGMATHRRVAGQRSRLLAAVRRRMGGSTAR